MLHINDLTYRIGGRVLFDGATMAVPAGHKAGIVGPNGSGKSTLFRLILGELHADGGTISTPLGASIGRVAQEAPGGTRSLIETVLDADTERAHLLAAAETEESPDRIAEIHTRLADIGAHTAPARAAAILAGLGFDEDAQKQPCTAFSGGWRMRVALAAALFRHPDILLLDEPTNHLDLEAALWLEGHLATWRGTLLLISHDRQLLNRAVDEIVHLEGTKLNRYPGGYDRFERVRRERLTAQGRLRDRQEAERRHIQSFVDRFRAKATKARQAQSRLKMLARMEPIATVLESRTPTFHFPEPEVMAPPLMVLDEVRLGYDPEKPVFAKLDIRIDPDDRIALIGANGNGKSTMMKALAGRLKPQAGRIVTPSKLRVGYFAQHQTDELDAGRNAYQHLSEIAPKMVEPRLRAHLGRFGFEGEKADIAAEKLSGGEKARLLFALMSIETPGVLLLDEPTNHLDVDAREALVQALNEYKGAVVLVSHDAHLIDLVADRLWLVADGDCKPFDGDLDDYRRLLLDARRANRRADRAERNGTAVDKKAARQARARDRAETKQLRQAIVDAEKRVENLGMERARIQARLADPDIYKGPVEKVTEARIALARVEASIRKAEEAWLAAQAAMEGADAEA